MKFIRDIIAEKANKAESAKQSENQLATRSPATTEVENPADPARHGIRRARRAARQAARLAGQEDVAAQARGGSDDFIQRMEPEDRALEGVDQDAGAGIDSPGSHGSYGMAELPVEPDIGFERDQPSACDGNEDEFDLLGDAAPVDDRELAEIRAEEESDGLFADLWSEPVATQEPAAQDIASPETVCASEKAGTIESQVKEALNGLVPEEPANVQPMQSSTPNPTPNCEPTPDPAPDPAPDPNLAPNQVVGRESETSPFQRIMEKHGQTAAGEMHCEPVATTAPPTPQPVAPPTPQPVAMPAPAAGRVGRQAGRVKTRLLGFNAAQGAENDPFNPAQTRETAPNSMYPVGWIVVVSGPGCGNAFTLFNGVSQIGRGEGQAVRLDFGDNSISRSNHAAVAYDGEQRAFFLGHGGKANLVRLDGNPVLSTEPLRSGALIRIGETTLRFVALCSQEFDWDTCQNDDGHNAQFH